MSDDVACEHDWKRVPPVVVVVNDPLKQVKGGKTYNAVCLLCHAREWLHWPVGIGRGPECGRE